MTFKTKRIFYNSVAMILYIVIITIPFLDWNKKNKIHREFTDLEFKIYDLLPTGYSTKNDSILLYCDRVKIFIKNNPIEIENKTDCEINAQTPRIEATKNFISFVRQISDYYRKKERTSNHIFLIVLIVSQIPLYFARKFIENKFKEKLI